MTTDGIGDQNGIGYMSIAIDAPQNNSQPEYVTPGIPGVTDFFNFKIVGPPATLRNLRITVSDPPVGFGGNEPPGSLIEWRVFVVEGGGTFPQIDTGIFCSIAYDVPAPLAMANSGAAQFDVGEGALVCVRCRTFVHKGPNRVFAALEGYYL